MLTVLLLATIGVDWSDAIVARVDKLETRADATELRLRALEDLLVVRAASPTCTCKVCKCDSCSCGLAAAPVAVPELPKLYVATSYECVHCDRLRDYLDSNGILYDVVPDNVGEVPRFVANGQTVIGNRPADVGALIGIHDELIVSGYEDATYDTCGGSPRGDAAEPRRRFRAVRGAGSFLFHPLRGIGRLLFRKR